MIFTWLKHRRRRRLLDQPFPAAWRQILEQRPDALLYPTMPSGGPEIRIEDRYAHIVALAEAEVLGLGLVDPGTTNIGRFNADGSPRADDCEWNLPDGRTAGDLGRTR